MIAIMLWCGGGFLAGVLVTLTVLALWIRKGLLDASRGMR